MEPVLKPWPKRLRDIPRPAPAVLLRDVETGIGVIPKGARGVAWASGNSWTDLRFQGEVCSRCKVKLNARGLSTRDLALVEEA